MPFFYICAAIIDDDCLLAIRRAMMRYAFDTDPG